DPISRQPALSWNRLDPRHHGGNGPLRSCPSLRIHLSIRRAGYDLHVLGAHLHDQHPLHDRPSILKGRPVAPHRRPAKSVIPTTPTPKSPPPPSSQPL